VVWIRPTTVPPAATDGGRDGEKLDWDEIEALPCTVVDVLVDVPVEVPVVPPVVPLPATTQCGLPTCWPLPHTGPAVPLLGQP
jgi:hypothetical protein